MKIIDISMKIRHDMPVYGGNPAKKPSLKVECDHSTGSVYETRLEMNMHTGTHIDAPLHMLPSGSTIDTLPLEKVVTKCRVLDLTLAEDRISAGDLEGKGIADGEFILLKTKNSFKDILEHEFIFVDKTGAEYLKSRGICGVGIDSLGIERSQPEHETHRTLLGAGVVILEGLDLKDVAEGEYLLVAAPLLVEGAEAAPARALLLQL